MPVDRLEERLARAHVAEVLGHDVHVVAVGVQRRDVPLRALLAVVAVVVVDADVRDVVLAEHAHEPAREGGLARRRVADDAEDDRPCQSAPSCWDERRALRFVFGSRSSAKTLLLRMSSASILIRSSRGAAARGLEEAVGLAQAGAVDRVADAARVREPRPVDAPLEVLAERLLGALGER